jgi:hypothetical protein
MSDDADFIRAMRRIADNHEGNPYIRVQRSHLGRLVSLAEQGTFPAPNKREDD